MIDLNKIYDIIDRYIVTALKNSIFIANNEKNIIYSKKDNSDESINYYKYDDSYYYNEQEQDNSSDEQYCDNQQDQQSSIGGSTIDCDTIFNGINISSRDVFIDGFTIEYDPPEKIIKDQVYTYDVIVNVTHNDTGCTKTFTFKETTYPDNTTTDKYGRVIIPYNNIEPVTCIDEEVLEYAINNNIVFVAPNDNTAEKTIVEIFKVVLGRNYIDSDALEHYSKMFLNGVSVDDIRKQVALDAQALYIKLPKTAYRSRKYLGEIGYGDYDTNNRVVDDICLLDEKDECYYEIVIRKKDVFVKPNISDRIDVMINKAYNDVLNRTNIDNNGMKYWYSEVQKNNYEQYDLNVKIAESAISILGSGICSKSVYSAYIYLNPVDANNREFYKINDVVNNDKNTEEDNECIEYVLSTGLPSKYWFVIPKDDLEIEISKAYKDVLNRNYVDSNGMNFFYEWASLNNPTYYQLCLYIAHIAADSDIACNKTKERARQFIQSNIFDLFGNGSIISLHQFNDNLLDYGGLYNGQAVDTIYYSDDSVNGKSLALSGSGNVRIDLSGKNFPSLRNNDFSISIWIKVNQTCIDNDCTMCIVSFRKSSENKRMFELWYKNKSIVYKYLDGSNDILRIEVENIVTESSWLHIAITTNWSTNESKIYINNNLVNTSTNDISNCSMDIDSIYVGAFYDGAYRFKGNIDQFRIYKDVLTEQEIDFIYRNKA